MRTIHIRKLKGVLMLLLCLIAFPAISQQYSYVFKIDQVTSAGEAKMITDPIRKLFNESSNPYSTFPRFIDARDEFSFTCPLVVTREQLEQLVTGLGHTVTEFRSAPVLIEEEHNSNSE